MNIRHMVIGCMVVGVAVAGWVRLQLVHAPCDGLVIGIMQTASHPALDRARQGCVDELRRRWGGRVTCIEQNAEGAMATAQTIAQSFARNDRMHAVVTIGSLATQAMQQVEKHKPIVFCAVTDPATVGVGEHCHNICGVSDALDIDGAVATMRQMCPSLHRIAMLYNPAEVNSVSLVARMEAALRAAGMLAIRVGVHNEAELPSALAIIMPEVDALWVPTDNTIANAMGLVGRLALKAKKPLFISDGLLVTHGVLAAIGGVDYEHNGRHAAEFIDGLINHHRKPRELGVAATPSSSVIVEKATAQQLGITIPESLASRVTWKK